jgi:hypothetical protein
VIGSQATLLMQEDTSEGIRNLQKGAEKTEWDEESMARLFERVQGIRLGNRKCHVLSARTRVELL